MKSNVREIRNTLGTGPVAAHYRERVKRLQELAEGVEREERKKPAPSVKRKPVGAKEAQLRALREEQSQATNTSNRFRGGN